MDYSILCTALREFTTGLLNQLLVNLAGQDGQTWYNEFCKFLRREECWTKPKYGKLRVVRVHKEGENSLSGSDYLTRARKETSGRSNKAAFDHYSKPENWHLIPDKDDDGKLVEVVVFVDTEFTSDGRQCVRSLYRPGARWRQRYDWVDGDFPRLRLVGVPASTSDSST